MDMALEQGKEVYVVPGRITDRLSDGCNGLLKQGAGILRSPEEFLEEIHEQWNRLRGMEMVALEDKQGVTTSKKQHIPPQLRQVYDVLDFYPQSVEQLLERLQSDNVVSLNTSLMRLCLEKQAVQVSPGYFCRC